jgi:hypothetical protein
MSMVLHVILFIVYAHVVLYIVRAHCLCSFGFISLFFFSCYRFGEKNGCVYLVSLSFTDEEYHSCVIFRSDTFSLMGAIFFTVYGVSI